MTTSQTAVIVPGPEPAHDFPKGAAATVSYVIASVQRTGSSLLARGLWESGVAGAPNEYFNPLQRRLFDGHWGKLADFPYVEHLRRHRTSGNGRFGIKVHAGHLGHLTVDLTVLLPGARYIAITRVDEVAQAVSFEIARQTGIWTSDLPGSRREPIYDSSAIERCLVEIRRAEVDWERFFTRHTIGPLRLTYERLVEDYELSLRASLDFLGVGATDMVIAPPALRPLARNTAGDWYERFRTESDPGQTIVGSVSG